MFDPGFQIPYWLLAALLIVLGFAGLLRAWAENFACVGWNPFARVVHKA